MASQTSVLQNGTSDAQQFLNQLAAQLPRYIQCIQLTDIQTNNILARTCRNEHISSDREYDSLFRSEERFLLEPEDIVAKIEAGKLSVVKENRSCSIGLVT